MFFDKVADLKGVSKLLFDTRSTQAAEASLDALWLKTQVISNNMANVDTPGFKAKSVSFAQVLEGVNGRADPDAVQQRTQQMQENNSDGRYNSTLQGPVYRTTVSTATESSVRIDGNNVSLEEQQSELWKTYAQYSYLLDRISGHYGAISTAITNMKG
ncbi:MAG: flagellar basal body rod protein FlgB [Ruminococcaceae bacterium]|nr:flagellar basal body rod protein FlgB [Oscillospiraceae bacterium]